MHRILPNHSIRYKLTTTFIAVAAFVAAFVGIAIGIHFVTVERAAQLEAEHVGDVIADMAEEEHGFAPDLQDYVFFLASHEDRDIVVVDADGKGIADADPAELGDVYSSAPGNEVAMTIRDGVTRTFLEKNARHPRGARQIVVPMHRGHLLAGKPIGAVILEYGKIRDQLFIANRPAFYAIVIAGIVLVSLIVLFGITVAGRIAQPLRDLQAGVERIAVNDYGVRMTADTKDELGRLGAAFNRMAADLGISQASLLENQRELETRIAERTSDLAGSRDLLQQEVEQHRLAAERLDYLAYYDVLTGLANQRLFLERVAQYLRGAAAGGHKLGLVLIDLERFKNINDSLGQPAGDAMLRHVARVLTATFADANLVGRVGADLFAAVIPEVSREDEVGRLLERTMVDLLARPFLHEGGVYRITAKFGAALFPDDGDGADLLFRHAEAALKKAKASGERYLFYTPGMTDTVAGKLMMENQLRQALDREEFVLHYQPKVDLRSGLVTGAEALIRWNDPRTGGLTPPGKFIPILEETGLIYDVGRWALRQAIADYLRWRAAGLPAVRLAVNVSALQLRNRGFIADVAQVLAVDAHAARGLELEITESMIMDDVAQSIASLEAIRELGVCIAIDDFGTGFSSLGYLSKLPIDVLKIDRSFVIEMNVHPEGMALVTTIINLAHSLNLKVVAEGVETEDQAKVLRLLKCDQMQGFLFSRPVPGDEFAAKFLFPACVA